MSEEMRKNIGREYIRALLLGKEAHVVEHRSFTGRRSIIYEPYRGTNEEWTKIPQHRRVSIYPEPFDKRENFKVFMDCPFCTPEVTQPFVTIMSARTHMQRIHPDLLKRYIRRATYEERT